MNHRCVLKYFSISLLLSMPYIQGMDNKGNLIAPLSTKVIEFLESCRNNGVLNAGYADNIPLSPEAKNLLEWARENGITDRMQEPHSSDAFFMLHNGIDTIQNPVQNIISTLSTLQTLTSTAVTVTSAAAKVVPYMFKGFKAIGTYTFFQQEIDDQTTASAPNPQNTSLLVAPGIAQVNNHNSINLQIQDYIDESYLPFREDMENKKQQKIAAITAQGLDVSAYVTKADAKIADYTKKVAKILVSKKHGNNLDFSVPPASHWLQIREKTLNKCYTTANHQ